MHGIPLIARLKCASSPQSHGQRSWQLGLCANTDALVADDIALPLLESSLRRCTAVGLDGSLNNKGGRGRLRRHGARDESTMIPLKAGMI